MARKSGSYSEITGPRIREAALRLIAAHGFAAVSMRQIAGEVGVQAGALYLYTPDKQSLLFDLMREHAEELATAWEAEFRGVGAVAALEAFVRFHIGFHLDRPEAAVIAEMEARNLEPENLAAIEALRARYEGGLETILADGAEAGEFAVPDARLAAVAIIAMLSGVAGWVRGGGKLARDRVERISWNMVRRAVGAKQAGLAKRKGSG